MKTTHPGWRLGLLSALLLGSLARAEEGLEREPREEPRLHRFTLYVHTGGGLYLSDYRTQGGIGGGLGIRDTLKDRFILQADARYLLGLGNTWEVRVGAGLQRRGVWNPAVLVLLSAMAGPSLRFLMPERSTPVVGPALTLGVQLAPLRFTHAGTQVSLLAFGVGVGSDWPGLGKSFQLTLVEAGTCF